MWPAENYTLFSVAHLRSPKTEGKTNKSNWAAKNCTTFSGFPPRATESNWVTAGNKKFSYSHPSSPLTRASLTSRTPVQSASHRRRCLRRLLRPTAHHRRLRLLWPTVHHRRPTWPRTPLACRRSARPVTARPDFGLPRPPPPDPALDYSSRHSHWLLPDLALESPGSPPPGPDSESPSPRRHQPSPDLTSSSPGPPAADAIWLNLGLPRPAPIWPPM
jgi:hypothetical protein